MAVWAKILTSLHDHPKAIEAGPQAMWIYVCMILHAKERDTSGFVHASFVHHSRHGRAPLRAVSRLVGVGLVHETERGWQIAKYDEKQGAEASVSQKRANDAARKRRQRERDVTRDMVTHVTPLEQSREEQSRNTPPCSPPPDFVDAVQRLWRLWPPNRRNLTDIQLGNVIEEVVGFDAPAVERMIAAATADAASVDWRDGVIPRIDNWIRQRKWDRPTDPDAERLAALAEWAP